MFCHEVAVGLILQSESRFKIHILEFITLHGVAFDRNAVSLDQRHFLACLAPVIPLAGSRPDVDIVDRGARQIKLKCEVLTGAIDNGMLADDEFSVTQMRDNFVIPVFNSDGLPLTATRFSDAIAKVRWKNPSVTINRRIDLEVIGVDLNDTVIATAAAGHEAQICRFSR